MSTYTHSGSRTQYSRLFGESPKKIPAHHFTHCHQEALVLYYLDSG
jgi:acetyl esterase